MEDKVQEFLKKYEINPYAEDCFAMEEKIIKILELVQTKDDGTVEILGGIKEVNS